MDQYLIYTIGFIAQGLFSARLLIQWISSEKAGQVRSPVIYWYLSLFGSFLLIIYGIFRRDPVIVFGQAFSYYIYLRNLYFQKVWEKMNPILRSISVASPMLLISATFMGGEYGIRSIIMNKNISGSLIAWGSIGQIIFGSRFIYQWVRAEQLKESVLPLGFWLISLAGSFMILVYAVYRRDPVLFVGQMFGFIIYIRNIILRKRTVEQQTI